MPRGKKSKARAREKRDQNKDQPQGLKGDEGSTTESSSCSALASGDAVPSTSSAGFPQKSQAPVPTTNAGSGDNLKRPGKGAKGRGTSQASSSGGRPSSVTPKNDLLKSKTEMLMDYMLCKYKMKQPIVRGEMVRVINKRLKEHFPEILKRASQRLDVAFGLELEEVQPNGQSFKLVSKLEFQNDGSSSSLLGLPTMGVLIPVLSVIYLNGGSALEETIWEFLNNVGVYDGISHIIFGDARKLITEDLVQEGYLEYRQVPDSDPPVYQFLWGPQANTDSCMEKVVNFLIRYKETITPDEQPDEDAWWEEEDKCKAEDPANGGTKGKGKGKSKGRSKGKSKSRKHK